MPRLGWPRDRVATTLLAAVAIAVIVALLALGVRGASGGGTNSGGTSGGDAKVGGTSGAFAPSAADGPPCGAATDAVARSTAFSMARLLRDEEHAGRTVAAARRSIT